MADVELVAKALKICNFLVNFD